MTHKCGFHGALIQTDFCVRGFGFGVPRDDLLLLQERAKVIGSGGVVGGGAQVIPGFLKAIYGQFKAILGGK